jgi:hypothetical protein
MRPSCRTRPCGDAVGGHDVETDAGAQNDAGAVCFIVDAVRELEHFDLAGDIQVMHVCCETALHHRARGL